MESPSYHSEFGDDDQVIPLTNSLQNFEEATSERGVVSCSQARVATCTTEPIETPAVAGHGPMVKPQTSVKHGRTAPQNHPNNESKMIKISVEPGGTGWNWLQREISIDFREC